MATNGGISSGPSLESIDVNTSNPTIILDSDVNSFARYGVNIIKLVRKGRYGAVYSGQFSLGFKAEEFLFEFKYDVHSLSKKKEPKPGQMFAVKYVDIPLRCKLGGKDVAEAVHNDINGLMALNDDGIVELFFAFKLMDSEKWFLFEELADGNLQSYLKHKNLENKKLRYDLSKKWIKNLAKTVRHLHGEGITHGQIRPSNILIFIRDKDKDLFDLKICDFVFSQKVNKNYWVTVNECLCMEYRMLDDLDDLYFVFQQILNTTQFQSEEQKTKAEQAIELLANTHEKSIKLLDAFLTTNVFGN